ncbi:MAG: PAS domain-containing protein, partial [Acidobacteria bacterium]|nr:PAS domain-containing protein [Acidobacteriota bacterium]
MRELVGLMPLYTNIVIVDREGHRVCSALREPPGRTPGLAGSVAFRQVVDARRPVFGVPTRGLTTGRWIVPLWYPRLDAQGELVGAVALPLDVAVLEKELARLTRGAGEAISILASDGSLVARSSQSVRLIERKASYPSLVARSRGETAEPVEVTGVDGVERIAAVAALPAAGWFVYAGLDREVLLEPVYKARRRAAALVAVSLAAALLAAVWASRRIADPIAELAAAARRLQPGSAPGRVPVAGPAEVAQVARDLNAALDARERAEADLRTIIDHSPEFIHLCDPQGRILLANRAFLAILGTDAQGARGRAVRDFAVPQENADRFEAQLAEVLRTGQPVVAEGPSLRPQGPRHLLIHRFPVRDADGRIRAVGSIAVDVTGPRRLTDALRESEARFRTLAELAPVGIYRCDAAG